jgi:thiol:disulfide interchange protein
VSQFQQAKMWLVETLHLAKDALHIYVALLVFFGACLLFRWKAWQWKPWLCVLAVALAGEVWDLGDSFAKSERLDFYESLKDLWNTMLVPTLLVLLARYSALFGKRGGR